jgi:hypothetical protein
MCLIKTAFMLCSGLEDQKLQPEMRHLEENRELPDRLQSGSSEQEKILQENGKLLQVLF